MGSKNYGLGRRRVSNLLFIIQQTVLIVAGKSIYQVYQFCISW